MESTIADPLRLRTALRHDIPSLDGLRALAIAIVIVSHTRALIPASVAASGLFRYLIGGGLHGVQVFFVISGYLITTLLVREYRPNHDISLARFYARRTLRIFPPYYVYLAILLLLWIMGLHSQDGSTFFSAATYTIIYHPHPRGWLVEHAWSLSVEEQFYLLWPMVLLAAMRRGMAIRLVIAVLLAMPIVRTILFFAFDHNQRSIVNCSSIDMLMTGCLLALIEHHRGWERWCSRWIRSWSAAVLALIGLLIVPYADAKLARTPFGWLVVATGYTITAFSIGASLEYVVRIPQSIPGKLLNLRAVRHIGVISYSIYLWQQLFTENPASLGIFTYALIWIAAELSFWLIEKPLVRLRMDLAP